MFWRKTICKYLCLSSCSCFSSAALKTHWTLTRSWSSCEPYTVWTLPPALCHDNMQMWLVYGRNSSYVTDDCVWTRHPAVPLKVLEEKHWFSLEITEIILKRKKQDQGSLWFFFILFLTRLFVVCFLFLRSVEAENECSRGKPPGPCHAGVTQEEGLAMRHLRAKVKTQTRLCVWVGDTTSTSTKHTVQINILTGGMCCDVNGPWAPCELFLTSPGGIVCEGKMSIHINIF